MVVTVIMTKGRGTGTGKDGSNCNNYKRKGGAVTDRDGSNCNNDDRGKGL